MHPLHVASSCAPAGVAEIWWASLKRAIGAVVARFVHTEEVTGSNPVSPTNIFPSQKHLPSLHRGRRAGYVPKQPGRWALWIHP